MKIGVTLNLATTSLFGNGVNQNAIYLTKLFKNIGYDARLIYVAKSHEEKNIKQLLKKYNIPSVEFKKSSIEKWDVIMTVGLQISKSDMNIYKAGNPNLKLVHYKCGNEFFAEMENIILNKPHSIYEWDFPPIPDQIWSIPQMEETNIDYYSFTLNQRNATVVPFVWDPMAIEDHAEKIGASSYQSRDIKRVGIMEPNLSFMKNAILPLMITENYYRNNKNLDVVRVFSGTKIKDNERLLSILKNFSLFKDRKLSMESRHNTISVLKDHIDVIVSWQMENNLNYLYLDAAWFGYPVIHNANLCPDIGYYYQKNNIFEAASCLNQVIKKHNADRQYLKNNRDVIKRYLPDNKELQNQYKTLLEDLVNDNFKRKKYDWKTNTVS